MNSVAINGIIQTAKLKQVLVESLPMCMDWHLNIATVATWNSVDSSAALFNYENKSDLELELQANGF